MFLLLFKNIQFTHISMHTSNLQLELKQFNYDYMLQW